MALDLYPAGGFDAVFAAAFGTGDFGFFIPKPGGIFIFNQSLERIELAS